MKIICIGRNYSAHAEEMNAKTTENPLFFMKPDNALLRGFKFYYPDFTKDLHYEVELVVKINKVGKYISEKNAPNYYSEIGLGIDFTARDLQKQCKANGHPWEIAKSFDNSAVCSSHFLDKSSLDLNNIEFHLKQNETIVQKGNSKDMLFSVDKIISYISQFQTLKTGDLIYTGTPAGVGSTHIGDKLKGYIGDELCFSIEVK